MQTVTTNNRPSNYRKLTYAQKSASVNRRIRRGDITKLAETLEYSVPYVSQVISGRDTSERIINAAYNMTRGRITNDERLEKMAKTEA